MTFSIATSALSGQVRDHGLGHDHRAHDRHSRDRECAAWWMFPGKWTRSPGRGNTALVISPSDLSRKIISPTTQ